MKNTIDFNLSKVYIVRTKRFVEDCKEAFQYEDFSVYFDEAHFMITVPETVNGEKKYIYRTFDYISDEVLDALSKYYGFKIKWIDALYFNRDFIVISYEEKKTNNSMTYDEIAEWLECYKPSDVSFFDVSPEKWAEYAGQENLILDLLSDLKRKEKENENHT